MKPLDIPSSNFAVSLGKKSSKYAENFQQLKSVPAKGPNHKDPTRILQALPMDQKYKDLLGPDPQELVRLQKKVREAEKAKEPKLDNKEEIRVAEEEAQAKALPTAVFQDEQGRVRDKEGKVIVMQVVEYLI